MKIDVFLFLRLFCFLATVSFHSSLRSLTYEKSVVLSFPSGRVEVLMRHKKPEIKASDRFDLSRGFDK